MMRRLATRLAAMLGLLLVILVGQPAHADVQSRLPEFLGKLQPGEIFPGADHFGPVEGTPPAAIAFAGDRRLGYVYLNTDVANATGYSGKPIVIVIGLALDGKIMGAKLVEHHEPIVLVGIPQAKVENFIHGYVGLNFLETPPSAHTGPPVDIVSGATVSMMVIGDSITRSSIALARSRGVGGVQAGTAAAAEAA